MHMEINSFQFLFNYLIFVFKGVLEIIITQKSLNKNKQMLFLEQIEGSMTE